MTTAIMPDPLYTPKLPREVINDELSHPPDLDSYADRHWDTHYDFRAGQSAKGYWVTARPYANWRERSQAWERLR